MSGSRTKLLSAGSALRGIKDRGIEDRMSRFVSRPSQASRRLRVAAAGSACQNGRTLGTGPGADVLAPETQTSSVLENNQDGGALFGGLLEGSWGLLEATWSVLAASWAGLGSSSASWSVLWASRGPLGQSWGPLGALLARSGGPERPYPGGKPSLSRPGRAAGGLRAGYFSPGDPQGPPRARELEILLTSYRRS